MAHQRFSLFPDSPHMRQVFSARSIRARWRNNDPVVTVAIMLVCIALWIVELLLGFLAPQLLNGLLQFGMFQPASAFREPWTFITSMFLHEPRSIFHILFNMLTLWAVGPFLERLMGHWAYLVLYAVSGIGSGMGMMVWAALSGNQFNWLTASYGASGALFGLFAACLVVYRKVGEDLRSMLIWMGINFLMPLITPNIAWQAHLGRFVVGSAHAAHNRRRARAAAHIDACAHRHLWRCVRGDHGGGLRILQRGQSGVAAYGLDRQSGVTDAAQENYTHVVIHKCGKPCG